MGSTSSKIVGPALLSARASAPAETERASEFPPAKIERASEFATLKDGKVRLDHGCGTDACVEWADCEDELTATVSEEVEFKDKDSAEERVDDRLPNAKDADGAKDENEELNEAELEEDDELNTGGKEEAEDDDDRGERDGETHLYFGLRTPMAWRQKLWKRMPWTEVMLKGISMAVRSQKGGLLGPRSVRLSNPCFHSRSS